MIKKIIAYGLVVTGTMFACIQWWQISYRLKLFFHDYGRELHVNHIGDGDFVVIYIVDALLVTIGIVSIFMFSKEEPKSRILALCPLLLNALGWITLFVMHRTGVLVEYSEFIWHMKMG